MKLNPLPIVIHCGWCHSKKKTPEGTWVPLTADDKPQPGEIVSHGMCDACTARWADEEKRINREMKQNETDVRDRVRLVKKK